MNKEAKKYTWSFTGKNVADEQAREALRSRVRTEDHKISKRDKDNRYLHRIEKKAASSVSKGFKFTPSTSGAAKTQPKMPKADKTLKAPSLFNQKVTNPNKSLIKKSSLVGRAKNIAGKVGTFAANSAKGTGRSIGEASRNTVQHAGGKTMRDFARTQPGIKKPSDVAKFMSKTDSEKMKSLGSDEARKQLKGLIQKRDASRVGVAVAGAGAVAGGVKGKEKYDEFSHNRRERQRQKLIQQYYAQQRGMR